jgi:hypothetical protein
VNAQLPDTEVPTCRGEFFTPHPARKKVEIKARPLAARRVAERNLDITWPFTWGR